jgi:hypothetical protein
MTQEEAYVQGFIEKCAEYNVNPEELTKEAQLLNLIGRGLAGATYGAAKGLGKLTGSKGLRGFGIKGQRDLARAQRANDYATLQKMMGGSDDFLMSAQKVSPNNYSFNVGTAGGKRNMFGNMAGEDLPDAMRKALFGNQARVTRNFKALSPEEALKAKATNEMLSALGGGATGIAGMSALDMLGGDDKEAQAIEAPPETADDGPSRLSAYLHQLIPFWGPGLYGIDTKPEGESSLWEGMKSIFATPVGQAAGGIGGFLGGQRIGKGRGALPGLILGALIGGGEALHATRGD